MDDFVITSFIMNTVYLVMTLLVFYGSIRIFNFLSGISFDDAYHEILQDPVAISHYLGARTIALAILASAFLG